MNEEFLTSLGLDGEISAKILAEYNAERLETEIEQEFEKQGVCDKKALGVLLERDGLTAENLSQRVEMLKTEHPSLFKKDAPKIVSSAGASGVLEKDTFSKMGYKERLELFKKSPDLYKKLVSK